jgi:hypothetical protein
VSLVARYLEERGLPTLCMASALDIIKAGWPPRAVFVDYPLGHTTGKPFAPAEQLAIVRQGLAGFETMTQPGSLSHLDFRWADDDGWKAAEDDTARGDQRQPRDTTPRYQTEADRQLAKARLAAGG